MKKIIFSFGVLFSCMLVSPLYAATGEWWEISSKMEMEGMPFAMPAQANKVCMPKGGESDPRYTQGKDSECKMSDVKQSGNTVKFKGTCVRQGETMNIVGETTHSANSFKSNVKMSGKSHGEPMNMSLVSNGKRIGGSCDTEEMGRKVKAQVAAGMAAACDTSSFKTINWINSSSLFIGAHPTCPGKKEALCKVVRNEVPHDMDAFDALKYNDGNKLAPSISKACNVSLSSMTKSLCKAKAKSGPLRFLEANCPAEAKAYRELQRRQLDCEGRGFTGVNYKADMKKCMGGEMVQNESRDEAGSSQSGSAASEKDSGDSGSEAVRQGTKVLKGLFGF